jgi:hypothetical protein
MKGENMAPQNKYLTHVLPKMELIKAWARRGAIEEDIARNLNVGVSTFSMYKNKYPELKEALEQEKDVADLKVESALFKRAVGYTYTETKEKVCDDGSVERTTTVKEVVPDTTAQIFWLKNRRPDLWRDKQDIEHSGGIIQRYSELSDEELEELIEKYEKIKG